MCGEVGFEPTLSLKPGLAHRITKRPTEYPSPGAGEVTGKLSPPRTPACRRRTRGEWSTPACPARPGLPVTHSQQPARHAPFRAARALGAPACSARVRRLCPSADSASARGGALPSRLLHTEQRAAFVTCRPTFRAELGAGAQPRRPGSGLVRVGLKAAETLWPGRRGQARRVRHLSGPDPAPGPVEVSSFGSRRCALDHRFHPLQTTQGPQGKP